MERKLIPQGKGGLTFYVPKKWADAKHLEAGDVVSIKESENNLIISSDKKTKPEIELAITSENKHDIKTVIGHAYRKGFDKIILRNAQPYISELKKIVKDNLMGFEITSTESNVVTLENISEPEGTKYPLVLRRILLILKDTLATLVKDLSVNNYKNKKELEELKEEQDRAILWCKRIISKEKYERDAVTEWEILTFLLHLQHDIVYTYIYAAEHKMRTSKDLEWILEALQHYFELFERAILKEDISAIYEINQEKKKYQFGKCLEILENSKGQNIVALSYIRELFRTIQRATSPLLIQLIEKRHTLQD